MNENNTIWVFIEVNDREEAAQSSIELLNPGSILARDIQGELVAVLIGQNNENIIHTVSQYGCDQIITVEDKVFKDYSTDAFSCALSNLIRRYSPLCVMIAATENGRDLGPRVACKLKTGLTADCTGVSIDKEKGCIIWTRPALGGNLMARIVCEKHRPQMGTIRPGTFEKRKVPKNRIKIIREKVSIDADLSRIKVYETIFEDGKNLDLEGADIIIAGGRGVGSKEGFTMLYDLADALGGEVGASRGAVEQGWISHTHQVGQTGRIVRPRIYIACGISGAIQHLAGMSASDTIIAINNDRNAPIFNIADYGFVGDLGVIIPALTERIRKEDANIFID